MNQPTPGPSQEGSMAERARKIVPLLGEARGGFGVRFLPTKVRAVNPEPPYGRSAEHRLGSLGKAKKLAEAVLGAPLQVEPRPPTLDAHREP